MSESSSDASQSTNTDQQDNRIAAAPDSIALVASRSSVGGNLTINKMDMGAVDRAFDFAEQISQGAASQAAASSANITAVAKNAMDAVQEAYQDIGSKVANAYTEAKAGEQKILVGGALLIGSVVAIAALKKG